MSIRRPRLVAAAGFVGWLLVPSRGLAQTDFRNLDSGRPSRVTDAYPVERYAVELSFPYSFSSGGGRSEHSLGPRIDVGLFRNGSVDIGFDLDVDSGVGVVEAGLLWNVRRETPSLPAVSFAVEAAAPVGDQASSGGLTAGLLATRSVGRSRLHLNGRFSVLGDATPPRVGSRWWLGAAWDRTLIRSSTVLVAEAGIEREVAGADLVWSAGLGFRRQIAPTWVLLGGLNHRFEASAGQTTIRAGLSNAFALGWFRRGGAR
ncbi:MAG: hypothetical protein AB7L66_00170 [Gemmatimonadales bacterium]